MDAAQRGTEDRAHMATGGPGRELAAKLWPLVLVRGLMALALGAYALMVPPMSPAALARPVAVYWIVDGLLVLRGSRLAVIAVNRALIALRSIAGLVTAAVILGLPLGDVFGPWRPGQLLLFLLVVPFVILAIALQIGAGIFDTAVWLEVRRRISGAWPVGLGAILSIVLGLLLVATSVVPIGVLGRTLGVVGLVGGLAMVAGAIRLRPPSPASLRAVPR
jgi:uncharacterized membrane protein HdeD (DUF308 family)